MDSRVLSTFQGARVAVLGDIILDRFVYGAVSRVSPEAPVPVLLKQREAFMLGGAANVARNVAALGGHPVLVGVVGEDAEGALVAGPLCQEACIQAETLVQPGYPTAVKTRFVCGQQQIMRLDIEEPLRAGAGADLRAALLSRLTPVLSRAGALVLPDYGKGVLSADTIRAAIAAARRAGVPVIVDPVPGNMPLYRGASVVTPNAAEAAEATGEDTTTDTGAEAAARRIVERDGIGAALVTRGPRGMTLFAPDGDRDGALHLPTHARKVFDVSGAGDTVAATLALMLAAGHGLPLAAELANRTAGLVVAKPGTAAVTAAQLASKLTETVTRQASARIVVDAAGAASQAEHWRGAGLRVGFTNGCFDLIHPGHVTLLHKARAACDRLIVALNTDASVTRLKGTGRPIQDEQARATVVAALRSVDLVTHFGEDTPMDLIRMIRPDVLIKGTDYTVETTVGSDLVLGWGGDVVLIPLEAGQSTTRLANRAGNGLQEQPKG